MLTGDVLKDTLRHVVDIQSFEVRCREVILELLPQVKERVETVWHQDVLEREEIKREAVNVWPINSCRFIALIFLFAQATKAACATLHKACGRIS